jgi:predicted NBD/HSP70 family sugar kinase
LGSLREIREAHRASVVAALRERGALSRAELAAAAGVSRTTTAAVIADLLASGVAVEEPVPLDGRRSGPGRPPRVIRLDHAGSGALGVEIGRHHVRMVLSDLASNICVERVVALDDGRSVATALDAVQHLADELFAAAAIPRSRVVGAAVSLPGPVDRATHRAGPLLREWQGIDAPTELARRLGVPVEIDNDSNLAALGEQALGNGQEFSDLIYIRVSWGIGAAIVLNRRLHRGATGLAGEIGHVQIDPDGDVCACGSRGCLGTVAALSPILRLLRGVHGDELTPERLLELVRAGDPGVVRVLFDAGATIGRALAALCNAINPSAVVVGGELAEAGPPLLDGIRSAIERHALPDTAAAVTVLAGALGERATVLGALASVIAEHEREPALGLLAAAAR